LNSNVSLPKIIIDGKPVEPAKEQIVKPLYPNFWISCDNWSLEPVTIAQSSCDVPQDAGSIQVQPTVGSQLGYGDKQTLSWIQYSSPSILQKKFGGELVWTTVEGLKFGIRIVLPADRGVGGNVPFYEVLAEGVNGDNWFNPVPTPENPYTFDRQVYGKVITVTAKGRGTVSDLL